MLIDPLKICNLKLFKPTINYLKRAIPIIVIKMSITLFLICFLTSGCTLIRSKIDTNRHLESTGIVGRVYAKFLENGPIIVAARSMSKEKEIVRYTVLHDSGEYELRLIKENITSLRIGTKTAIWCMRQANQQGSTTIRR